MATSKRKNLLTLERHPASALFPDHDEATFRRLKKDIEANGLKQKIDVDADWRVVDGWHRYCALRELASEKGVSLKPECFNVHRRAAGVVGNHAGTMNLDSLNE